ncbi:hypothetical protein Suden_1626 [Sulfurimonas denitrificans DSM 1251]|uniref:Uncharacterized protein n=1 Tax=Sulfurimonas denitrificans (strain ATCC 33889 / DSM 1251) TaxID=326298 RepID=Q30Q28_SULDN|nr:hypothetical protein [Sulfurimonas denitrificans]ABB44903.1 hypothetical protein Suden_1626 [Sulfurimonas denitrificans DSM 1251]
MKDDDFILEEDSNMPQEGDLIFDKDNEKLEEPKKPPKKYTPNKGSTSPPVGESIVNTQSLQELLSELSFISIQIQKDTDELKKFEGMGKVISNLESIKNKEINIDVAPLISKIESEINLISQDLKTKAAQIKNDFDFSELDEIKKSLQDVNNNVKKAKSHQIFWVALFAFGMGMSAPYVAPYLNVTLPFLGEVAKKEIKIVEKQVIVEKPIYVEKPFYVEKEVKEPCVNTNNLGIFDNPNGDKSLIYLKNLGEVTQKKDGIYYIPLKAIAKNPKN